ncbi:MAG: hypothetical protein V1689_07000 [Pseudomonadota bacterium]
MKEKEKVITRRDFMRTGSCMVLGGLMGLPLLGNSPVRGAEKESKVALVREKEVMDNSGHLRPDVLQDMLDRSVTALFGISDPVMAWKRLVEPTDIVGIKSNVWYHLPTPRPLEEAIRRRVMDAGVREENVSVDDRGVLRDPVFEQSTALINVRPMRTHDWSGLGTLIKNYIMFVDNPWSYHGNACENLGAIWKLHHVKGKTRLNVLVMLTPLFYGTGPHHFNRKYTWPYCGLIVSIDPVAADAIGARIIQAKRNLFFGKVTPISPPPRHIEVADTRFGLGNSREELIHLIRLGWDENILI